MDAEAKSQMGSFHSIDMFGCEKASFPHPLAICEFYRIVAGAKLKSLVVSI